MNRICPAPLSNGLRFHDGVGTSYDRLEYLAFPVYWQHPARLEALAWLCGQRRRDPSRARILDLACGQAATSLLLAEIYPEAEILGVDLSARQIDNARKVAKHAGLSNLRLECRSILDLSRDADGAFDYITCSGAYSWVPDSVQNGILSVFGSMLRPGGLAAVRYSVSPAFFFLEPARGALLYHANRFPEPEERLRQAVQFGKALTNGEMGKKPGQKQFLDSLADSGSTPGMERNFWHEHLGEIYRPTTFDKMARQAESVGLRYVADAEKHPIGRRLSSPTASQLAALLSRDAIELEQYLDLIHLRTARLSVFTTACSAANSDLFPERADDLLFQVPGVEKPPEIAVRTSTAETFRVGSHRQFATSDPLVKCVLAALATTRSFAYHSLRGLVSLGMEWSGRHSGSEFAPDARSLQSLRAALLHLHEAGVCQITVPELGAVREAAELEPRPFAMRVTRAQADLGLPAGGAGLRCATLTPATARVLALCDGTRDALELDAALQEFLNRGFDDLPAGSRPEIHAILSGFLRSGLLASKERPSD